MCLPPLVAVLPAVDSVQDGQLSVAALECLQHALKVPLLRSIGALWQQFAESLGILLERTITSITSITTIIGA